LVSPATGERFWHLSTGVDEAPVEDTRARFAREAGAGRDRIVVLVLDAGHHTLPLAAHEGPSHPGTEHVTHGSDRTMTFALVTSRWRTRVSSQRKSTLTLSSVDIARIEAGFRWAVRASGCGRPTGCPGSGRWPSRPA
jgi:hypothetical protein